MDLWVREIKECLCDYRVRDVLIKLDKVEKERLAAALAKELEA